jgi:hypothetical protein
MGAATVMPRRDLHRFVAGKEAKEVNVITRREEEDQCGSEPGC